MTDPMSRSEQKAQRREQLLRAAAGLFAEHGFRAVRLEDIGAGAGVSGPAVYRHFPSKEAVLTELLVGISERLADGGRTVVGNAGTGANSAEAAMRGLVDFHVDFAVSHPELIRIQDRDFPALPQEAQRQVRKLQRIYVQCWAEALQRYQSEISGGGAAHPPDGSPAAATVRVQAVFGLINSTPHLGTRTPRRLVREQLTEAAHGALGLR